MGAGATSGGSGQLGAYPYAYPAQLKTILNYRMASTNDGALWGQLNAGAISYDTYDTRLSLGSGWAGGVASIGGKMWANSTTTNALGFTPSETFDTIDVYSVQNTGHGTFTIDVDGGAALATVNASGTLGFIKTTVTCSRGTHTINIRRTGVGGMVYIAGIVVSDSTSPAVSVWDWGWSGSTSTSWATNSNPWEPSSAIITVAPDLTIMNLGINDMGVTSVGTFKTNIQTIVTAALTNGDCIITIPNPVSTGSHTQSDQDAIRQALLDLAAINDLPVVDQTYEFESYTQANALGLMYDGVHPNKYGYAQKAALFAKALVESVG